MNRYWLEEIEQAIQQRICLKPSSLYEPFQYTMGMGVRGFVHITLLACGVAKGSIQMQCMLL